MSLAMQKPNSVFSWIYHRPYGGLRCGAVAARQRNVQDVLWKKVSSNKKEFCDRDAGAGGIFGLSYAPNGEVLAAACEDHCFVLMDPLTHKVICLKRKAHSNCCNNITFLDDRTFASCSDDSTVAVWDLRYISNEICRFSGHSSWVKNVEVHKPSGKIVTSGFDELINICDVNAIDDEGCVKVDTLLEVEGLLRMRLSPQGDSMYFSSNHISEVVAIQNLDLGALNDDIGRLESVPSERGVWTRNKRILADEETRHAPLQERNHINLIWTDQSKSSFVYGSHVACHSIDVHPRNSALLLHHISQYNKWTAVHNVKTQIYPVYDIDSEATPYLTLPRSSLTHVLHQGTTGSGEYIEEVSFSSCGRLIASPSGYGVAIAAFDLEISDYEVNLIQQACSAPKAVKGQKRKKAGGSGMQPLIGDSCHAPQKLHVLKHSFGHRSQVLSTSFSPTHLQLATGCKDGFILFHNPVL